MSKVDLKNYICSVPFRAMEVHQNSSYLCCPSWLPKALPKNVTPYEAWNSKEANDIRESILDGSYKYCDRKQCPFLQQLTNYGEVGDVRVFTKKTNTSASIFETINKFKNKEEFPPSMINFSFDRTCNLKCPSCRLDLIVADSIGIKKVKQYIETIENQYGKDLHSLYITGTGDPFVSVGFRDFLRNFDESRWPNLQRIHLHTNATKWTQKMWESMPNIHKYVKSCEISIDAGTKDTYENKTRIGGNWDELIENLNYISSIKGLTSIKTSFVVQKNNYKEMKIFYDLMTSIFGNRVNIFFGRINNWGTFSEEEYKEQKVWDYNHPDHQDFLREVNSILPANNSFNNLQEFISGNKSLI